MTDKDEDETETDKTKKLTPGEILSFGSIDLLLTLDLEKSDLKKYKKKWEKIESLENLKFILKHKNIWKKIELSSKNDTLNILLHINKSSKKIIKVGYISFQKIKYTEEQKDFEKFINKVINENGLFITSCDVCQCNISIQLLLKYEKEEKLFLLCGEPEKKEKDIKGEDDNKIQEEHMQENNEEKKENNEEKKTDKNKNEDYNPFTNIGEDIVKPGDFNFIYFKYSDYINGEFKGQIKIEHLYEYFQTLKIITKSKIILNLEEENIDNNDILRDLLSITDIYIFYNKNKLYELLKQIKMEEDNSNTEKLYEYHFKELERKNQDKEELKQREEEKIKHFKSFLEKKRNERIKNKAKKKYITITLNTISNTKNENTQNTPNTQNIDNPKTENNEKENISNNENQNKQKNENENENQTKIKKENIYITQSNNEKEKEKEKEEEINKVNEIIANEDNKDENKQNNIDENKKDNNTQENNELKSKNDNINNIIKTDPSNDAQSKEKKGELVIQRKSNSLFKKNKLTPITISPPQPLDKNELFEYFKFGICDRDPQKKSNQKLLLVFDEFKKIFFVNFNKNNIKPNISDFDLKLYPQMNLRNMKEILEFKKFIKSKFSEYIKIFMGILLSAVLSSGQEKIEESSLFLGYLCATNTIKKIAEIQKYNLPMPKEKEFFYPSINKAEVDKLISKANERRKEKSFILDGNSKKNAVIKQYNPLLDKNLFSFFNSQKNRNFLKINGIINQNGEINYDPIYRETLGFTKFSKNNDKDSNITFHTTNKFLIGFKKTNPGYSIYNPSKSPLVLPPIEQAKAPNTIEKERNTINEEETESGSGSGSGGSGSGNGDDSGSGSGSGDDSGSNDKE